MLYQNRFWKENQRIFFVHILPSNIICLSLLTALAGVGPETLLNVSGVTDASPAVDGIVSAVNRLFSEGTWS